MNRFSQSLLFAIVTMLVFACAPAAPGPTAPPAKAPAAPAQPSAKPGKALLDDLVAKARQEGKLVVPLASSWSAELGPRLTDAFNKRFDLKLETAIAPADASAFIAGAIAEAKSGAPATYDVMPGIERETVQLIAAGAAQTIDNWEALLAEVNSRVASGAVKPDQVSRGPLVGQAFIFMAFLKQTLYNPKLITAEELPNTHAELTDPKYKDKFVQPPWTAHWEMAPAALENLDREKWLDTVRQAGKNTGAVLTEAAGAERVLVGQYAFVLGQDTYIRKTLAADPGAPLRFKYFKDYNPFNSTYSVVRKGARNPAAGTLWALWMTTSEAEAIWQQSTYIVSPYGDSEMDRKHARDIKESNARIVSFMDDEKTVAVLNWYQTPEGTKYLDNLAKAIKGQ